MKHLLKEMKDRARYMAEDNKAFHDFVNQSLEAYLDGGEQEFTYRYFVNEKVGNRSFSVGITDLLSEKINEIPQAVLDYHRNPSEANFISLINCYYMEVLTLMTGYMQKTVVPAHMDMTISSAGLLALGFFGPEEQNMVMNYLRFYLDNQIREFEQNENPAVKRCFGASSVMPLYILLSRNHSESEPAVRSFEGHLDGNMKPLNPVIEHNLNPVYAYAYEHYLSDDEAAVTKLFQDLGDYHRDHCRKDSKTFYVFDSFEWRYLPAEMLCLLKLRMNRHKSIDFISHPLIDPFKPYLKLDSALLLSETSLRLKREIMRRSGI